jgi:exodeoxyribonuclease V alpha subunit
VLGDLVHRSAAASALVPQALAELVADDLVDGELATDQLRNGVVRLTTSHRFGTVIGALAAAVKAGNDDEVVRLLRGGGPEVEFVQTDPAEAAGVLTGLRDDVVSAGRALVEAARLGDAATALGQLDRHRLLCAHRRGPYGVARWAAEVERWLAAAGLTADQEWYAGRPLLVTANDYELQLFNGDTGVVVEQPHQGLVAAFTRADQPVLLSPHRLSSVQTVHAMTVHRAQGSQFQRVTLVLPTGDSPLLSRELFYTAITRAEAHVRVVGTEEAVRRAVTRPIVRASGLGRLRD